MENSEVFTVHVDGASRGNPGPAAFAYVFFRNGALVAEEGARLGETTNNIAEYTALVRALEKAAAMGVRDLAVNSDSELMVKQMNGHYRVKNEDLRVLFDQAQQLLRRFNSVTIRHVRREQNSHADRLCNEALDGVPRGEAPAARPARRTPAKPAADRKAAVSAEAVECLRAAAAAWARGGAGAPSAEDVWDQLWSILEEGGVLARAKKS